MYDRWDRSVLKQDGNLRNANNWIYTKYDEWNRPIYSGIYNDPVNISLLQINTKLKSLENVSLRNESRNTTIVGYTLNQIFPKHP